MSEKQDKNKLPITQLLRQASAGDQAALNKLSPYIYNELKKIAQRSFRRENAGHTLQPTAVLNQAFEKIVDVDVDWQDRQHFYAFSARLMRRILVDHAKAKTAEKRGGGAHHTHFDEDHLVQPDANQQLLELGQAIENLNRLEPRKAQVIELVYFGGMTYEEVACYLNISKATIIRDLKFAEAWLKHQLGDSKL